MNLKIKLILSAIAIFLVLLLLVFAICNRNKGEEGQRTLDSITGELQDTDSGTSDKESQPPQFPSDTTESTQNFITGLPEGIKVYEDDLVLALLLCEWGSERACIDPL